MGDLTLDIIREATERARQIPAGDAHQGATLYFEIGTGKQLFGEAMKGRMIYDPVDDAWTRFEDL